jgi:hypothetical protein
VSETFGRTTNYLRDDVHVRILWDDPKEAGRAALCGLLVRTVGRIRETT